MQHAREERMRETGVVEDKKDVQKNPADSTLPETPSQVKLWTLSPGSYASWISFASTFLHQINRTNTVGSAENWRWWKLYVDTEYQSTNRLYLSTESTTNYNTNSLQQGILLFQVHGHDDRSEHSPSSEEKHQLALPMLIGQPPMLSPSIAAAILPRPPTNIRTWTPPVQVGNQNPREA